LLPAATEAAWAALRPRAELGGFVLVGGTALSLLIGHRQSEDLDLAWPDLRLPVRRITLAMSEVERAGLPCERHDDPAAVAEFLDTGLELHDYQQDYLVGGAKVSFFAVDAVLQRVLSPERESAPRVASLKEIFASKCLVTAQRSRLRDWFDLYVLLREHGFSLRDYVAVFEAAGEPRGWEAGLARLCSGHPDRADEGFKALVEDAPGVDELRGFFVARRNELEVALAAERLGSTSRGSSSPPD